MALHELPRRADGKSGQKAQRSRAKRTALIFPRRFVPKKRTAKRRNGKNKRINARAAELSQLEPDIPYPPLLSQFCAKVTPDTPERRLLYAMLDDGIRCALELGPATYSTAGIALVGETPGQRRSRALRWIREKSMQLGGFGWVTELLGMDTDTLSEGLLAVAARPKRWRMRLTQ